MGVEHSTMSDDTHLAATTSALVEAPNLQYAWCDELAVKLEP
jgi:hypothetical protein